VDIPNIMSDEEEMGRAYSMRGRDLKRLQYFWLERLKGRDRSEDQEADGRITLERILGK
jgi:hypothetical protein